MSEEARRYKSTGPQKHSFNAKLAEELSERNEQYSRRNNIKLLFIEESPDTFELAEKSEEKALIEFSATNWD